MNDIEKIKALSERAARKKRTDSFSGQSDMDRWFNEWCESYCSERFNREITRDGDIMYLLEDGCIFNRGHHDASVLIKSDGKICYHCFHDSCQGKHWQDFRQVYEPNCYDLNRSWETKQ